MLFMPPQEIVIGTGILAVILSAGGAAMVAAIVQAYRSIKDGAKADDKDYDALEQQRMRGLRDRADYAERLVQYWRGIAADLEYIIRTKLGPDLVPEFPPPPEPDDDDDSPTPAAKRISKRTPRHLSAVRDAPTSQPEQPTAEEE